MDPKANPLSSSFSPGDQKPRVGPKKSAMKPTADSLSDYASVGGTSATSGGKKVEKRVELPVRSEIFHEWGESTADTTLLQFVPEYPSLESAPTAVFKRTSDPATIIIVPLDSHEKAQPDIVIDISRKAFHLLDNRLQEHVSTEEAIDYNDYDRSGADVIYERANDEKKFTEVCDLIPSESWGDLADKRAEVASVAVVRNKHSDAGDVDFYLRNYRQKSLKKVSLPAAVLPSYITEKLRPDTHAESEYLKIADALLYDYTETLNPRKTAET